MANLEKGPPFRGSYSTDDAAHKWSSVFYIPLLFLQSWDDEIAMVAQTYAENCMFEHDDSYKRMIPGE